MSVKTKIIYSSECLGYRFEAHPESPERVQGVYKYLKDRGYGFVKPKPAKESDLSSVHDRHLVDSVKYGNFFEQDTPNVPGMFRHALLSSGAAILASDLAITGASAFSLMRPPGHHAGIRKLGGFCYFNNIAVAVRKLLDRGKRVAILDIDCHHGQGTQEIFIHQPNVLYASLHQIGIYPNTGLESEDNCRNYPLTAGTGPDDYLDALSDALTEIKIFRPDIIGVSAGFDTYREDPLTGLELDSGTYTEIGSRIARLGAPVFMVLEGGYSEGVPGCVFNFLTGLDGSIQ